MAEIARTETIRTQAPCNNCGGQRNHEVLFSTKTHWHEDDCPVHGTDEYEVLKCGGCDRVILRHTSEASYDPEPTVRFYPPPIFRKQPSWPVGFLLSPNTQCVRKLLNEIYIGIQNDSKMIATMGVRALLEHVMIDSVGDHGTFSDNLKEFTAKGFISEKQRTTLDAVFEAGHATMHRSYQPSDKELQACVDIAESILQTIYVHPQQAANLSRKVPKRK